MHFFWIIPIRRYWCTVHFLGATHKGVPPKSEHDLSRSFGPYPHVCHWRPHCIYRGYWCWSLSRMTNLILTTRSSTMCLCRLIGPMYSAMNVKTCEDLQPWPWPASDFAKRKVSESTPSTPASSTGLWFPSTIRALPGDDGHRDSPSRKALLINMVSEIGDGVGIPRFKSRWWEKSQHMLIQNWGNGCNMLQNPWSMLDTVFPCMTFI